MQFRQPRKKDYVRKSISFPADLNKKLEKEAINANLTFNHYVILKLSQ